MTAHSKKKTKKSSTAPKKATNSDTSFKFPATLLSPVRKFLSSRLKDLEKQKKGIESEDPFKNTGRVSDNASPDADAEEQFGHARISALGSQLDRKIIQTKKALAMIKVGTYGICEDCGKMIDTDRLTIYPSTTICVKCESKREK